jgi:hypothetical protein
MKRKNISLRSCQLVGEPQKLESINYLTLHISDLTFCLILDV